MKRRWSKWYVISLSISAVTYNDVTFLQHKALIGQQSDAKSFKSMKVASKEWKEWKK